MLDDLRLATRSLVRRPGFALVAMLTLALGIGANTAIFSVVNRLMLNPLPFHEFERIVTLDRVAKSGGMRITPSVEHYEVLAEHAKSFEVVAPFSTADMVLSTDEGEPEFVRGGWMTEVLPRLLRVRPVVGRFVLPEDTKHGGADVAVLGHGFWRRRYAGDPDALGARIVLDGKPYTIVGVMDPALDREQDILGGQDVWIPLRLDRESLGASLLARLREGITLEQAGAETTRLAAAIDADHPFFRDFTLSLRPPVDTTVEANHTLVVMLGAVGMVLLVACANVANLLLARAASRRHEIGVRLALGASRGRLVRTLLVESILLALAGGALGLLFAVWGVDAIAAIRPDGLEELASVSLAPVVLWFTFGVSVLAGVLFGLVPALRGSRPSLAVALRSGTPGTGITVEGHRLRAALVVLEVALSVSLLVGAGLLVRSVMNRQAVAVGYEPGGLLTAQIVLPDARHAAAERQRIFDEILERARAIPGVEVGTVATNAPPRGGVLFGTPRIEGGTLPAEEEANPMSTPFFGGPEMFTVFRIPLREGRPADPRHPSEVVINEGMAKRWWPGESAVGKRFALTSGAADDEVHWRTVVGVAGDVVGGSLDQAAAARQIYGTFEAAPPMQTLIVRARPGVDPMSLVPALRSIMASIDPLSPLRDVSTVEFQLSRMISRPRFTMVLLATFAALALFLSAIGIYGVISYTVAERTREIGIRMALGARPQGIVALVVRRGLGMTLLGVAIGVAGALAGGQVLAGMLFEVGARDPLTIAVVAAMVLATALAALLVPARRATRVDPAGAMRAE